MAMPTPEHSIPPDLLEAMLAGERQVLEGLLDMDPAYRCYVRRHRAERIGEPLGPKDYHAARDELSRLYQRARAPKGHEDVDDMPATRGLRIKRIYHLEWLLFA